MKLSILNNSRALISKITIVLSDSRLKLPKYDIFCEKLSETL